MESTHKTATNPEWTQAWTPNPPGASSRPSYVGVVAFSTTAPPPTRSLLGTTARPNSPSWILSESHDARLPGLCAGPQRIATFDNDGTLWCEQPMYVQLFFALDRVKALAPQHPEWKTKEPFASLLKGDVKAALAGGEHALLEIVMATHAGMTTEEFEQIVKDWIATAKHPKIQAALHRDGLSADARTAGLPAGERFQDLHRLRRRHRVHAPVDGEGLWHPAGTGRRQQRQDEV